MFTPFYLIRIFILLIPLAIIHLPPAIRARVRSCFSAVGKHADKISADIDKQKYLACFRMSHKFGSPDLILTFRLTTSLTEHFPTFLTVLTAF